MLSSDSQSLTASLPWTFWCFYSVGSAPLFAYLFTFASSQSFASFPQFKNLEHARTWVIEVIFLVVVTNLDCLSTGSVFPWYKEAWKARYMITHMFGTCPTARESETSRSIIRKNLLRQLCPLLTHSFNSFSFHFTHFRWYLGMVMNDV